MSNSDVRIAYYTNSKSPSLAIKLAKDKMKLFKSEYVQLMAKGHRLYIQEGEKGKGVKLQANGIISLVNGAQELRSFEGEYDLIQDGKFFYVDKDQVRPFTTGGYENKHSMPANFNNNHTTHGSNGYQGEVETIKEVKKTEVKEDKQMEGIEKTIVEVLRAIACDLLFEGNTSDAEAMAKAVKILEGLKEQSK